MEDHHCQALRPRKMGDNVCDEHEYVKNIDINVVCYKYKTNQLQWKRELMISKHRQLCDVYVMNFVQSLDYHYNYLHLNYLNNNFRYLCIVGWMFHVCIRMCHSLIRHPLHILLEWVGIWFSEFLHCCMFFLKKTIRLVKINGFSLICCEKNVFSLLKRTK